MTEKMKALTANGKGEKRSSNYNDTAVRAVFEKFYESLRRIGVTMLKEGQADERARHGRDRKSTRLNSSHISRSRMPSSA